MGTKALVVQLVHLIVTIVVPNPSGCSVSCNSIPRKNHLFWARLWAR